MTSFRKSLGFGIIYTAIAKYSNVFLSISIGAILARILSPAEFGIVAIVTVFVSFFNLLSDFGIGPAVVQNQDLSENDINSIFSFSVILGILFAGLFFFAASIISNFYNEPKLVNISRLLSLAILFYSFQVVPYALCEKKLQFKKIGIISVVVQLFSGSLAIVLAHKGFSYYAIVFKSIFDGFVTFIIYYFLSPVKIVLKININSIRKILRFSLFQFMFNFINYFSRNADNLLIGKYFSSTALGYYDKSYRLMTMPVANLTHVITPVLMPILSKYQNDKETVYNTYLKVVRILATIGFPLSVFLYFSASEIINIMYGSQWNQSIPVFKLLALTVGIQMVLSTTGSIFQVINRTDLLFYSGFLSAIFMVSGIVYGVFFGKNLEAVGYGLIAAFIINFFQGFYMLISRALNYSFIQFLKSFSFPMLASIGMGLLLWLIGKFSFDSIIYSFVVKFFIALLFFLLFLLVVEEIEN
ncbi:polysaccharide biosynthesis protein [Paludibacter propionicigenes WB4]|uniref:Polysaccharide biosynthesis protein n=1 Tax=Paludibacter propionicigenes (strain DSM 17365 / JCM 13257 / WB4) TaxID=694427 RepID=E4T321_PALPW|nr:lipopolysaccharide biosynthesis protein [Paludibacter propionicigenes]ADQ79115.1 polysaccharide biosynthesis protein [Paludibacter propionicigenes WB4]